MSPYKAYLAYNALKLHFKDKKFDFTRGFEGSASDSKRFEKSAYATPFGYIANHRDPFKYILANIMLDTKLWPGQYSNDNYIRHMKYIGAQHHYFMDDLVKLDKEVKVNFSGRLPKIIKLWVNEQVSIETVAIFNSIMPFLDPYLDDKSYPKMFREKILLPAKLSPIISGFNHTKYKASVIDYFSQTAS